MLFLENDILSQRAHLQKLSEISKIHKKLLSLHIHIGEQDENENPFYQSAALFASLSIMHCLFASYNT